MFPVRPFHRRGRLIIASMATLVSSLASRLVDEGWWVIQCGTLMFVLLLLWTYSRKTIKRAVAWDDLTLMRCHDVGADANQVELPKESGNCEWPTGISYFFHYEVWDELVYPFWNLKDATVEVWERMINFFPLCIRHAITYSCYNIVNAYW